MKKIDCLKIFLVSVLMILSVLTAQENVTNGELETAQADQTNISSSVLQDTNARLSDNLSNQQGTEPEKAKSFDESVDSGLLESSASVESQSSGVPVRKRTIVLLPADPKHLPQSVSLHCIMLMSEALKRYGYMAVAENEMIQMILKEKELSLAGMSSQSDADMSKVMASLNAYYMGRFDFPSREFRIIETESDSVVFKTRVASYSDNGEKLYSYFIERDLIRWLKKTQKIKTYVLAYDDVEDDYVYARFGFLDGVREHLRFYVPAVDDGYGFKSALRVRRVNANTCVLEVKRGRMPEVGEMIEMEKRFFD